MYTFGPATSFDTSAALLPQKEHDRRVLTSMAVTPLSKKKMSLPIMAV
jgi:hypothetical protein